MCYIIIMAENRESIFDAEPLSDTEKIARQESRFGNPQKIERILNTADVARIVNIDDYILDAIGTHSNEVDLAFLRERTKSKTLDVSAFSSNAALLSLLRTEDGYMRAIFKPSSGESSRRKAEFSITRFYPRERDAYRLDKALHFDVVPPTIIRKIRLGENQNPVLGSLQLFVPREYAIPFDKVRNDDREKYTQTVDWQKIAVLDYLINNADRKDANMLAVIGPQPGVIAIDHGCSFCRISNNDIMGPRRDLRVRRAPICQEIFDLLEVAMGNTDRILASMSQDILARQSIPGESIVEKMEKILADRRIP